MSCSLVAHDHLIYNLDQPEFWLQTTYYNCQVLSAKIIEHYNQRGFFH